MAHKHTMYDPDKRFAINVNTRIVSTNEANIPILAQYDHNSEWITFEIGRYVEGHDLSLSNKVEIHYNNVSSEGRYISRGVYPVEDVTVDPTDKSKVIFTWIISEKATRYVGSLKYVVSFVCYDDASVEYRWSTLVNSDLSISAGINNGEAVEEKYADVLEMWKDMLFGIGDTEESSMVQLSQRLQEMISLKGSQALASIPDDYATLQSTVDSLTEDDYISTTEMNDNIITETFDDGRYKVTTVSEQAITEKWYTADNTLTKTKTIVISQNGVSETITLP